MSEAESPKTESDSGGQDSSGSGSSAGSLSRTQTAPKGPPLEPVFLDPGATVINPPSDEHGVTVPVVPPSPPTANTPFGPGREPSEPGASLPDSLSGRYQLLRVLGKGGFANVYLAHDNVLDQDVAIKILKLGLASKADTDRFLFEARVGAKLRHQNIAQVFDIIQSHEGLQMIMEYYPNGTLAERVKRGGALRPREAVDVARQVALALAYAHRRSFVHRDVKPANIFFGGEGSVKLGDFGIAAQSNLHEHTQTGMIIGTPLYMAPEQAHDSRDVDPRADIYALGLTLYYIVTAKAPRVLDLQLVPQPFRRLIKAATEQDRNERLVSCEQFIAMLDQIETELSASGGSGAASGSLLGETVALSAPGGAPQTSPPAATLIVTPSSTQASGGDSGASTSPSSGSQGLSGAATAVASGSRTETLASPAMASAPGKGLYAMIALGFVILAIPLFYLSIKLSSTSRDAALSEEIQRFNENAAREHAAKLAAAQSSRPRPGSFAEPAPAAGQGEGVASPPVSPALSFVPPVHSAVRPAPSPRPSAGGGSNVLPNAGTPSVAGASVPHVPSPSVGSGAAADSLKNAAQASPAVSSRASAPPVPLSSAVAVAPSPSPAPALPQTWAQALAQRSAARERFARAASLLAGAPRESNAALRNATLLQPALVNLRREVAEQPSDALTRMLLAVTLQRLGIAGWQDELGAALRLNSQSAHPLPVSSSALSRDLSLDASDAPLLGELLRLDSASGH